MKKKIIGISVVMLILALISSTSQAIITSTEGEGGLILFGTIITGEIENDTIKALAIRLRYLEWTETERWGGIIILNRINFPDEFHIIPLIGNLSFISGKGPYGLEVE